jgi:hypothetical protein
MDSKKFYDILKTLGEFKCVEDRRRFARSKRNISTLFCLLGNSNHICDFMLKTLPQTRNYNYIRSGERDGQPVKLRGNLPSNFEGRGRRWYHYHKLKKQ